MKTATAGNWKSETGSGKNSKNRDQMLEDKWRLSVINPNSLRDLVERFGIQEVAGATRMEPWTVARIIDR